MHLEPAYHHDKLGLKIHIYEDSSGSYIWIILQCKTAVDLHTPTREECIVQRLFEGPKAPKFVLRMVWNSLTDTLLK